MADGCEHGPWWFGEGGRDQLTDDPVNDARALRVAELVNDFRTLHLQICEHTSNLPSGSETQLEGYQILVRSWAAAQSLLDSGFAATPSQEIDDPEAQKAELRQ